MTDDALRDEIAQLQRRLERERRARSEAESIAERATGELYSAVQDVEQLNESLREFIAIAAHDMRTPLTSVNGYAALILQEWDSLSDGDKQKFVGAIERSAKAMARLCDDLLTVSRIEAGAVEPSTEVVALRGAVTSMVDGFEDRASEIHLELPENLSVLADRDHVRRILENYISNALKYGEPPVELRAEEDDGWVNIRVCDQGGGVDEEFQPRLFGRFARGHAAAAGAPGTGLGLSIVRGLAEVGGGTAWYEPNTPRGACFAVRLPIAAAGRVNAET